MVKSTLVWESPKVKTGFTDFSQDVIRYRFLNGQKFRSLSQILEKAKFSRFSMDFAKVSPSPDFLTPAEITDVEISWREIEEGKAKKFRTVDEFLAELKR